MAAAAHRRAWGALAALGVAAASAAGVWEEAVGSDAACQAAGGDAGPSGCATQLLQQAAARLGAPAAGGTAMGLPEMMRAARRGVTGRISTEVVAVPSLDKGQVLVKVRASSVNPIDWKLALPGPIGRDFAGEVMEVRGPCAFQVGDPVWGVARAGAYAEYVAVSCKSVGGRPSADAIGVVAAGALPHVGLTSLQALGTTGAPWSSSPVVVVLGGSGGVGHVAIQVAKALGASKVVTTCSPSNYGLVKRAGADQAIDYHTSNWWEVLGPASADVVLDAVGEAGTGDRAFGILRPGGWFVTLLGGGTLAKESKPDLHQRQVVLSNTGTQALDMLKYLVESGKLEVVLDSTYQLDDVAAAMERSKAGHAAGKIAIDVAR